MLYVVLHSYIYGYFLHCQLLKGNQYLYTSEGSLIHACFHEHTEHERGDYLPTEETDNKKERATYNGTSSESVSKQIEAFKMRFEDLSFAASEEVEEQLEQERLEQERLELERLGQEQLEQKQLEQLQKRVLKKFRHRLMIHLPQEIRKDHYKYLKESLSDMAKAGHSEEIFLNFNLYWSFIDYTLLKYIIDRFGSRQLKDEMFDYEADLSVFREHTTLDQMIKCWKDCEPQNPPPEFSKLTTKLDRKASEYTLQELECLRQKFCREFSLSKCFMMLRYFIEGSVIIVWMIPSVLAPGLTETIQCNIHSTTFFQSSDILELTLDGITLVSNLQAHLFFC